MREIVLLMKQNKSIYLTMLAFMAILTVRGTVFLQSVETHGMDVYVVLICVMLLPFSIGFMGRDNVKNKQFEEKLPIKKVALEMSGYVALMCMGVVCLLLFVFTAAINGDRQIQMSKNVFICLVLGIWATMTLFYLLALLFKRFIVGLVTALFCWIGIYLYINDTICQMYTEGAFEITYKTYAALAGATVLMIIAMVVHSKYRELSAGKICYFKWIEIVMILLYGAFVFICCMDFFGWFFDWYVVISLAISGLTVYLIYRSLYRKEKHVYKLKVSEEKHYKNPLLMYRLRYCIVFGTILTLVLLASSMSYMKERSREFQSCVDEIVEHEGDEFESQYIFSEYDLKEIQKEEASWFFDEHGTETIFMIMACLAWFVSHFVAEGNKTEKEFFESLPLSRRQKYATATGMGVVTLAVPFVLEAIANVRYYTLYLKYCNSSKLAVSQLAQIYGFHAKYSVIWPLVLAGFVLGIIGVSKLIDAVIENDILKVLTLLVSYGVVMEILPIDYYLVQTGFDKIENTIPKAVLASVVLGIVLIIVAGKLYEKRDNTRTFFYFKSALYVFSAVSSLGYGAIVLGLSQDIWGDIFAVCGMILVFVSCVHFLGGKVWKVK